jgi:hypothetical protein
MNNHELANKIASCDCNPCRAFTALRGQAGSRMRIRADAPGRMCEIAVVAGAGTAGMSIDDVVAARRAYAAHLGLELNGRTTNSPDPIHIKHAIACSNHTPDPNPGDGPIHLGKARAVLANGRVYVTWEPPFVSASVLGLPNPHESTHRTPLEQPSAASVIEIEWPIGPERIEINFAQLGQATRVRQTIHHLKRPRRYHVFETTSTIERLADGSFRLEIHYDRARNTHIDPNATWWGTTTIFLRSEDRTGTAHWSDADDPQNDEAFPFRVVGVSLEDEAGLELTADLRAIEARDLPPTEKEILIKARRGQGIFRAKVLQIEPRCRLTGTADPKHLRASHIKPWADSSDTERLDGNNGLMLAPHVDHLFDRALISFTNEGDLLVLNDDVRTLLDAWGLGASQRILQPAPFTPQQRAYLQTHRDRQALLYKSGS